jgi:hypothetical protein
MSTNIEVARRTVRLLTVIGVVLAMVIVSFSFVSNESSAKHQWTTPIKVNGGKCVSATTYYYTAGSNGTWKARIENHGLKSIELVVYVMTPKHEQLLFQRFDFASLGAYPTGTVWSNSVEMSRGMTYKIILKHAEGAKRTYALIYSEGPVPPPTPPTPENPTYIDPVERVYFGVDLGVLGNNRYVLSYEYDYGPVWLYRSNDAGATWLPGMNVFQTNFQYMEPGMCVYRDGTADTILVACGGGLVAKSTNGGATFSRLTDLPGGYWRFMAVGTNASWFGTAPDSDIYVVGSTTYSYGDLSITRSNDGGITWSSPVVISSTGSWPEMVSDGKSLYVAYTSPLVYDGALFVKKSSDWGATWSDEVQLVAKGPLTGNIRAYSFQFIDSQKALLTFRDGATTVAADNFGAYGYFDFATFSLTSVVKLDQAAWMVDEGLAGHMFPDGSFALAWSEYTSGISSLLMYTLLSDSGL